MKSPIDIYFKNAKSPYITSGSILLALSSIVLVALSSTKAADVRAAQLKGKATPTATSPKPVEEAGDRLHLPAILSETAKSIGSRQADPIDNKNTFYFRNGLYFTMPYIVSRDGYSYFLNQVEVGRLSGFPHGPQSYQENLPLVPPQITMQSSWKEISKIQVNGKNWDNAFTQWFFSHYPPEEAANRFTQALRDLPFVKTADWVAWEKDSNKRYLRVMSNAGDERDFFTSWSNPAGRSEFDQVYDLPDFRPAPAEFIRRKLDKRMNELQETLSSGDIIFVSPYGPIQISGDRDLKHWEEIVNVVTILKSDLPQEQKVHEISERLLPVHSRDRLAPVIKNLVENFQEDPQLDKRVEDLRKTVNIPLWKSPK